MIIDTVSVDLNTGDQVIVKASKDWITLRFIGRSSSSEIALHLPLKEARELADNLNAALTPRAVS